MNNAQLQEAIDKAREFILNAGVPSGPIWDARNQTVKALKELETVQATRAAMASQPKLIKPYP